jgi:hypothetical protein
MSNDRRISYYAGGTRFRDTPICKQIFIILTLPADYRSFPVNAPASFFSNSAQLTSRISLGRLTGARRCDGTRNCALFHNAPGTADP